MQFLAFLFQPQVTEKVCIPFLYPVILVVALSYNSEGEHQQCCGYFNIKQENTMSVK